MKLAFGCDHAGFALKKLLMDEASRLGHEIVDCGAFDERPSDYPDFAKAVGEAVVGGKAERAVLVCGSGVGASVAANKVHGIRAGLCHDTYSAHQGVEHDDMNVLVLGSRVIGTEAARECVHAFLGAQFTHEVRHVRRIGKIDTLEQKFCAGAS